MKKVEKNKKGFTLVELMVVIFIIASLSVVAVDSYMNFRRSSLINLTVDSFVSQVNEMRNRTSLGEGNRDRYKKILALSEDEEEVIDRDEVSSGCYVLRFENGLPVFFREDFDSTKVYSADLGRFDYVGCQSEGAERVKVLELENGVEVKEVREDGFVRFVPPRGDIESNFEQSVLVFGYENDQLDRYRRALRFDEDSRRFVDVTLEDE